MAIMEFQEASSEPRIIDQKNTSLTVRINLLPKWSEMCNVVWKIVTIIEM